MNSLLDQFLSESREALQSIGTKLMLLEKNPESSELITELFRIVHTLKGNSGLFEYPELTRVLHAGEDLMDAVRCGKLIFSPAIADVLLDSMDFIGLLCDDIEANKCIDPSRTSNSFRLAEMLRLIMGDSGQQTKKEPSRLVTGHSSFEIRTQKEEQDRLALRLSKVPEATRMESFRSAVQGDPLHWLSYRPAEECFFQGEDPFFQARQTPGLVWGGIAPREPWPKLTDLNAYRCLLNFEILSTAPLEELNEFFRYVTEQVVIDVMSPETLIIPQGDLNGGPVHEDFIVDALHFLQEGNHAGLNLAVQSMQELMNPALWIASALRWVALVLELMGKKADPLIEAILLSLRSNSIPDWNTIAQGSGQIAKPAHQLPDASDSQTSEVIDSIMEAQRKILSMPDDVSWLEGRVRGVGSTLSGCLHVLGRTEALASLNKSTESAVFSGTSAPLFEWLNQMFPPTPGQPSDLRADGTPMGATRVSQSGLSAAMPDTPPAVTAAPSAEPEVTFGRRAEDGLLGSKVLKVDQSKIDRLMNLIGEMVVAKNALPYLAGRADSVYGVRDLSREIKTQYAVINRIAEEMQDSIMQVRMMPVSFIFQRFPRLVRDLSHRLGKDVNLVLEGEDTEAEKSIIEALGDPLVHIVRNSLDHGIEQPEIRQQYGKPSQGTLTILASQEADRVVITIKDDGKGIDPEAVKRKAYEKGLIDEERMERMSDQEAIQLIFAPGFSTAEAVSDLSGRGVGMDVVRNAVEKVNGTILLESRKNEGTCLRMSLPLSMAVTNVMIIESDTQIFGVPMNVVMETVRVRRNEIHSVKNVQAMILRGRIIPLKELNSLLGLATPPKTNDDDEFAILVVSHGEEPVGILVDNFRESVDIILKPMTGVLTGLTAYSGSALLGDGSVLVVLNFKELL